MWVTRCIFCLHLIVWPVAFGFQVASKANLNIFSVHDNRVPALSAYLRNENKDNLMLKGSHCSRGFPSVPDHYEPAWQESQWKFKDENDEYERYSRTLLNPPCVAGRNAKDFDFHDAHNWNFRSSRRLGWVDGTCELCGARFFENWSEHGKASRDRRPWRVHYILRHKATGMIEDGGDERNPKHL